MKKTFVSLGILAMAVSATVAKTSEPVLMTVNGRPVYKSEFEYLYNKNAGQQLQHQTLDEYLDMFVNYKLKVADAIANGIDTTASFRDELDQYRTELAAPYMRDVEAENELLDEAYSRYANQIKVSHIMLANAADAAGEAKTMARLDSIRGEILAGRLQWDKAAEEYSIDRNTAVNGGSMGWLVAGRYPTPFEDAAYATKVGEISNPVNSGFGYHIVRVEDSRPNPGEVRARHILKLTARKSPEEAERAKEQIDSIYNVLVAGADFADVATRESEDPGSARRGGDLDWFGSGMMVAPFDSAAFALPEGQISTPVRTAFGWHIIEVTGHRPIKERAEMTAELQSILNNSDKGDIPRQKYNQAILNKYNAKVDNKNLEQLQKMIANNAGGYDSTMRVKLSAMNLPVAKVGKTVISLSEVMPLVSVTSSTDATNAVALIRSAAERLMQKNALQLERDNLINTNAEYRNLVNEYSDGILLFEVSQDRVWQRASSDREGLEAYFAANKDKYHFDEPRFKGYIIFTNSDSLETAVKDYTATLVDVNPRTFAKELRDKFGKNVRAERVIAKKGENAITDYLAFGGPLPDAKTMSWTNFFAFRGKVVDQPEEADDVRGQVITDYQQALENAWVEELHKKYPVKIDKKVLGTVKEVPTK